MASGPHNSTSVPVLGSSRAWLVWGVAVAFVIYYFAIQTGYSIVNPSIQKDLGLTSSQVGVIAAVYTWAYAVCQFFSGALLDRLGARKVLLPAVAFVTLGAFIFANAASFEILLLSQFVLALGACAGFIGAGYVGGQWFGMAKFSFMFGLVQFAASISSAFSQNLISWLLGFWSWQTLSNGMGVVGILLFVLSVLVIRNPASVVQEDNQGINGFVSSVLSGILRVARIRHVWHAALIGGLLFGVLLACGVVWAPKLMAVRGMDTSHSTVAASLIWLGLAAGCLVVPKWSDAARRRKMPILLCAALQLLAFVALVYAPDLSVSVMMGLCFAFGFGNAAHMLAFSTAADVVEPSQIGTASSLVNGIMFLMGGVLISRPGMRIDMGIAEGVDHGMALAQYAARPLVAALMLALLLIALMRETYPAAAKT